MTKKQHYMTWEERCQLEALLKAKVSITQIAKQLGFSRQAIYDEIERGAYIHTCDYWDEKRYSAEKGQQVHDYNQTAKGRPLKIGNDRELADFLRRRCWAFRKTAASISESDIPLRRRWSWRGGMDTQISPVYPPSTTT